MYIKCKIIDDEVISIKKYDTYFLDEDTEYSISSRGYCIESNFGISTGFILILDSDRINNINNKYIYHYVNIIKKSNFYRQFMRKEKLKRLNNVSKEK